MKPAPFEYHAPESLDEAARLLSELGFGAKVIAGGQSLAPMLALRLAVFDHVIDLRRIPALREIERQPDTLRLGGMVTQAAIEDSDEVAEGAPLLSQATPLIGHFQIRSRGTIGGSIAHADPAAEYPAVALALDATLDAHSVRGTRTLAASEFFTGTWMTALEEDEILTGVSVPVAGPRSGFAIEEFTRRHGDFAIAGAAIAVGVDAGGAIERARIALFGLGSTPVRASEAEASVVGLRAEEMKAEEIAERAVANLDEIPSDLHGSSDFRRRIGATMTARAWQRAIEEACRA